MRPRFTARAVAAEELPDLETFAVVLAEHEDGSGLRLELQRSLTDDADPGLDTYCLCTEDGACHYGGVASWSFTGRVLTLALDARAAAVFGVAGFEIEVGGDVDRVTRGLERVLRG